MYTAKLLLNPVISGSSSGINNHRIIGLFFFSFSSHPLPWSSAKKGRFGPVCDSAHIRSVPHVPPKLSHTPTYLQLQPSLPSAPAVPRSALHRKAWKEKALTLGCGFHAQGPDPYQKAGPGA